MNQVIWDFWPYKLNPQYKSFEKSSTNWIHDTKLSKKVLRIESAIKIFKVWIHESGFASPPAWIRKDLFCAIVLRILQDWWGFIGFVKTGQIFWKSVYKSNPRIESLTIGLGNPDLQIYEVSFVNHKMKQTFLESGFMITIRNKSMFLQISYTIPASLLNIQCVKA